MKQEWYAVRSVFKFGEKKDGKNIYEERIVLFKAKNKNEAFQKADQEAQEYLDSDEEFDLNVNYEMFLVGHGKMDLDGEEIWSFLTESELDLDEYFKDRYDSVEYSPDEEDTG